MSVFLPLLWLYGSLGGGSYAFFLLPCLWWGFGVRYFKPSVSLSLIDAGVLNHLRSFFM